MAQQFKLRSTIKYPTSLLVNGVTQLGLEVAESLLEQGGYVVLVDTYSELNIRKIAEKLGDSSLVSFIDYAAIPHLEEDLRRLDYVFYFAHEGLEAGENGGVSTQSFLKYSNYLDTVLSVTAQFEAKFLLTTSIRSHLQLMDNMDIEVNYGKSAISRHTVYTNMEVQRYSESLTLEYVNKVNLDARVARLGEIIGDGMDFSEKTSFTELVVRAVTAQELELKNDGLESEWYIHLLDAAYGIVRAQFSKDVKGQIFSVAYDNPVSDLSLAYKLQELEPNAREIKFSQEDNQIAPLKLHKPAPNLSAIGWRPRIDFEQSLIESLNAAKQIAIQPESQDAPADSMVGKLRSFLSIAKGEGEDIQGQIEDSEGGPVSRLIAERRRQEEARNRSIEAANTEVKSRVSKREKTLGERIKSWVYRNFFDTRTNLGFLRNVTPLQFLTISTAVIVFGILYFAYLAPGVVIIRNSFFISNSIDSIQQALARQDIRTIESETKNMSNLLLETDDMLHRFDGLAGVVAAGDYVSSIHDLLETYNNFAEGISNIAYAAVPLQDYLDSYSSNVRFRPSSENYLSTTPGTDYSIYLDDLNTRKVYADLGAELLEQAKREIAIKQVAFLPGPLQQLVDNFNTQLIDIANLADYAGVTTYSADILGARFNRTYLVLLLDNARPMPIGGNLSAYMLVTLQNGSISDIRVQAIDDFTPDLSDLPEYALDAINLNSYNQITNVGLRDLARIGQTGIFTDVVRDVWSDSFGLNIDSVVMLDLEAVEGLLSAVGDVDVEGQTVTSNNVLSILQSLQSQNETINRRNDVSAQMLAQLTDSGLAKYSTSFLSIIEQLSLSAGKKSIVVGRNDLDLNDIIESEQLYGDVAITTDMPIRFSLVADDQLVSPNKYPSFFENIEIQINEDSSMNVRLLAKFPAVGNISEAVLCLPLVAKEVTVTGVPSTRVRTRQDNNLKCSIVDIVNETEISYEWDTVQFESSENSEYNLSIGVSKLAGSQIQSNIEISLASNLSFSEIRPSVTSLGGRVAITEELLKDQIIELDITK